MQASQMQEAKARLSEVVRCAPEFDTLTPI
jgi:hypothetical protein